MTPKTATTTPEEDYSEVIFEWPIPEFEKYERGKPWYIVTAIIGLLLVIYSFWTINILFLIVLGLVAFILYLFHIKEVEEIDFKIVDTGIEITHHFTPWKEIKEFYIIYEPPHVKNIYFEFKKFTKPTLVIPLQKQNPVRIRAYLLRYLIENIEQESEPVTHTMGRHLKI